jgi:hypothetical protein
MALPHHLTSFTKAIFSLSFPLSRELYKPYNSQPGLFSKICVLKNHSPLGGEFKSQGAKATEAIGEGYPKRFNLFQGDPHRIAVLACAR